MLLIALALLDLIVLVILVRYQIIQVGMLGNMELRGDNTVDPRIEQLAHNRSCFCVWVHD